MILWLLSSRLIVFSQCSPVISPALSSRIANYSIDAKLDHEKRELSAAQQIRWINISPDTISELRLYMYINAFKNLESTFLGGTNGNFFGQDLSLWPEDYFGWIKIEEIWDAFGNDLTSNQRYIQPNDGNEHDQSVLAIDLVRPVFPNDTLLLNLQFQERLPKIIVRTGWAPEDYFAFLHWFPQMGVYQPDTAGIWGWNCHQFFRGTEFYADFGEYEVQVDLDNKFIVGSSGCIVEEIDIGQNRKKIIMRGEDIIDFAWIACPHFETIEDKWNDVQIKMLITPPHRHLGCRFIKAVKEVLEYMTERVGPYPYPMITIVDPPIQALNSGFMEYPTLITVGSFHVFPKQIRSIESLAMHEFLHQYFMGMVASNEKEEAWLDEGFVTYYEDRILDDLYGKKDSYIDILGYQMGNAEFSRQEYVSLADPNEFPISVPGWKVTNARKGIIYGKTALVLQTLEGIVGREHFDQIMKTYFERWRFRHPRGQDFIDVANEIASNKLGIQLDWFFDQVVYQATSCDFYVEDIDLETNSFSAKREGELALPTEVQVVFEDGSEEWIRWDWSQQTMNKAFPSNKPIVSVSIDPQGKIPLDTDMLNNSLTSNPNQWVSRKYFTKILFWVQNTLQTMSMLF